tara:strand:+ start:403 stop:573 length:171 start_codon:yes stop_codon:yes gene_type:complete
MAMGCDIDHNRNKNQIKPNLIELSASEADVVGDFLATSAEDCTASATPKPVIVILL